MKHPILSPALYLPLLLLAGAAACDSDSPTSPGQPDASTPAPRPNSPGSDAQAPDSGLDPGAPLENRSSAACEPVPEGSFTLSSNYYDSCGDENDADRAFVWTAPEAGWFSILSYGSTFEGNVAPQLTLLGGDCADNTDSGSQCLDSLPELEDGGDRVEHVRYFEDDETVTLVVDGPRYSVQDTGRVAPVNWQLSVEPFTCPAPRLETDSGAPDTAELPSESPLTATLTATGGGRRFRNLSCGVTNSDRQPSIDWTAPADGLYRVSAEAPAASSDTAYALAVASATCTGEELACEAETASSRTEAVSIDVEVALTENQAVSLILEVDDSHSDEDFDYTLNIERIGDIPADPPDSGAPESDGGTPDADAGDGG